MINSNDLPEQHRKQASYCPKCNHEMAVDFFTGKHGLPPMSVVMMANNILFEAGCPPSILRPVVEWIRNNYKFGDEPMGDEQKERLKLLRWKRDCGELR